MEKRPESISYVLGELNDIRDELAGKDETKPMYEPPTRPMERRGSKTASRRLKTSKVASVSVAAFLIAGVVFWTQILPIIQEEKVPEQVQVERLINDGKNSLKLGKAKEAAQKFEAALERKSEVAMELEPPNDEIYVLLSRAYEEQGDTKSAIEWQKKAVSAQRTNVQYRRMLAILYEQDEQYDMAREQVKEALRFQPFNDELKSMLEALQNR